MPGVLVLGGVSYNLMIYLDAFPAPAPQTVASRGFHETVGSTGAGKALNLGRLGLAVTLHGLIGDDFHGGKIREYLAQEPLTFVYDLDPAGTQRHVNLMDARGRRISIFLSYGSPQPPVDVARLAALIAQSDYVVLNIMNYCRFLIPLIQQAGKAIWCDIHDYDGENPYHRDFIQAADYVFLSSDALAEYRAFMRRLIAAGKQLVVCTHGRPDRRPSRPPAAGSRRLRWATTRAATLTARGMRFLPGSCMASRRARRSSAACAWRPSPAGCASRRPNWPGRISPPPSWNRSTRGTTARMQVPATFDM